MKLLLILMTSLSAGVASAAHIHSFLLGMSVASLAVGSCYWFAFRSTRVPELAVFLLVCGLLSKLAVTVIGVMWGLSAELITSPLVFALSYLFFSITVTYLWFSYRESITELPKIVRNRMAHL
ncbi:NADH:ubiquinone oxidoreductase [Vibrio ziniensis]|uniref:NADH:ubiquinone oxidoreductase n=1 Tax=Vibrio ziniensis TaxID=2711221 RepID=A0A6G7CPB9_9VIBR|nr:NADH:ubiquinone oxidoreductase [Vibrio ziniensis]QIH43987.1 NADH:ubiquinone oxidoreductase [Vibrio ziniensis]